MDTHRSRHVWWTFLLIFFYLQRTRTIILCVNYVHVGGGGGILCTCRVYVCRPNQSEPECIGGWLIGCLPAFLWLTWEDVPHLGMSPPGTLLDYALKHGDEKQQLLFGALVIFIKHTEWVTRVFCFLGPASYYFDWLAVVVLLIEGGVLTSKSFLPYFRFFRSASSLGCDVVACYFFVAINYSRGQRKQLIGSILVCKRAFLFFFFIAVALDQNSSSGIKVFLCLSSIWLAGWMGDWLIAGLIVSSSHYTHLLLLDRTEEQFIEPILRQMHFRSVAVISFSCLAKGTPFSIDNHTRRRRTLQLHFLQLIFTAPSHLHCV